MPERFPMEAALRDGSRVLLRPLQREDTSSLYEFFQHIPYESRRFAWDDVGDRDLIQSWGENIDYDKVFPLLALDGKRIAAEATLHRRKGGPLRLVGRVKWMVDPEYRGRGLGRVLVQEFVRIAANRGLRHLVCMLIADLERDAVQTLEELGFTGHVIPGYGTDPDGGQHDMVMMVLKVPDAPVSSRRPQ
ncbi:MAG: GNAT family N-acetyltransferase [Polyangiaceae bacterium]|nr:GNAT family N-acetyltransferase [Polyangiaceae bacterium]MBK8999024.1 GNAT family N-acetyltransferase [Myxococcales bacterium]MCE7891096.1 GNAT family N-acetyltransferase [Sorangiineae bacterium PRO1]MCL4750025.1 GNAT family N-acetyltransferase [Myxococcales bacterium]